MASELYYINELRLHDDVTNVDCHRKRITNINVKPFNKIIELKCYQNLMKMLPPLTKECTYIDANQNRIDLLELIPKMLSYLNLSRNRLMNINVINNFDTLLYLNVAHNFISKFPEQLPPNLQILICCENKLTTLPKLPNTLKILKCCKNRLQKLPELPTSLQVLSCKNNDLKFLPEESLYKCGDLYELKYDNNRFIKISESMLEYIDEIFARKQLYQNKISELNYQSKKNFKTVYSSGQNVHDEQISKDILQSVKNLLTTPLSIRDITYCIKEFKHVMIKNRIKFKIYENMTYQTPIDKLQYLCNLKYKHSTLDKTFAEIFLSYWNRIRYSKNIVNIIEILLDELDDMMSICFTGRISRLINTLNGFYDDIQIGITETAQIQAKYNVIHKSLRHIMDDNTINYNIIFKYRFTEMLEEIKLDKDKIEIWTEPFNDFIKDYVNKIFTIMQWEVELKNIIKEVEPIYVIKFINDFMVEKYKVKMIRYVLFYDNYDMMNDKINDEYLKEKDIVQLFIHKYINLNKLDKSSISSKMMQQIMEPIDEKINKYLSHNVIDEGIKNMFKNEILKNKYIDQEKVLKSFELDYC